MNRVFSKILLPSLILSFVFSSNYCFYSYSDQLDKKVSTANISTVSSLSSISSISNNYSLPKITFPDNLIGPEFAAKNSLAGFIVNAVNEQHEQKYFKANYIKNLEHDLHSVMIGSSHMLPVSSIDVGSDNYANLSIGGSNLQDRLDILGMLDYYNINYEHVIFEIDLPSFLDNAFATSKGEIFNQFGNRFYSKLCGENLSTDSEIDFNSRYVSNPAFDSLLINVYDESQLLDNIYYYRPDASMIYPKRSELFNEEHINSVYMILKQQDEMLRLSHISEQSKITILRIMDYFKKSGKKVNLIITPRPNREFDESNMKDYAILQEVTEFANIIANAYGFKISGSFNPHDLWLTDNEFADGFHLRGDVTSRIFDFIE